MSGVDRSSMRLVARRRLYDGGALVEESPSLRPLEPRTTVRVNPRDLDQLGVSPGQRVRVRSARGALELEVTVDDGMPAGVVSVDFNLAGTRDADGRRRSASQESPPGGAAVLIDARESVVDVRLETV
jgi:predicted molibdopterin-dependent oxidoreductase YjgC